MVPSTTSVIFMVTALFDLSDDIFTPIMVVPLQVVLTSTSRGCRGNIRVLLKMDLRNQLLKPRPRSTLKWP